MPLRSCDPRSYRRHGRRARGALCRLPKIDPEQTAVRHRRSYRSSDMTVASRAGSSTRPQSSCCRPDACLGPPDEPVITSVTLAELSVGPLVARMKRARGQQARLQQAEADFEPLRSIPKLHVPSWRRRLARRLGRRGTSQRLDAMIAATGHRQDLPVTR